MSACSHCDDRLVDLVYGELPESERTALEQHLQASPICRDEFASLTATARRFQRPPDDGPSPALVAGLKAEARNYCAELRVDARRALRQRDVRQPSAFGDGSAPRLSRGVPLWASALAATVAITIAGLSYLRQPPEPEVSLLADARQPAETAPFAAQPTEQASAAPRAGAEGSFRDGPAAIDVAEKKRAFRESPPGSASGIAEKPPDMAVENSAVTVAPEKVAPVNAAAPEQPSAAAKEEAIVGGGMKMAVDQPDAVPLAGERRSTTPVDDAKDADWFSIVAAVRQSDFSSANAAYDRWRLTTRPVPPPSTSGAASLRRQDESRAPDRPAEGPDRSFAAPPRVAVQAFSDRYVAVLQALQELPRSHERATAIGRLALLMKLVDDGPPEVADAAARLALLATELSDGAAADRAGRQLGEEIHRGPAPDRERK